MRNFRRVLIIILIILIVMTGCKQQILKHENGAEFNDIKKVEISVWHSFDNVSLNNAIKSAIELFNNSHSNINVTEEFVRDMHRSGSQEKLINAIKSGDVPDVIFIDRFILPQLVQKDLFEDLTEILEENNISRDIFYDFTWQEASLDARVYALPFDTDTRMLFYNKKLFRQAGLDPESPPKTISELDEYSKKLTKQVNGEYEVIGFVPWLGQSYLYTWGWAFGGKFYDQQSGEVTANHPQVIEALKWQKSYADSYNLEDVMSFLVKNKSELDPFVDGKIAMTIDGSWSIVDYITNYSDLEYGVARIPTSSESNFVSWSGGFGLAIPKGSKNMEAAIEFIKFMSIGEGSRIYEEQTGHIMSSKSINEKSKWVQQDQNYKFALELLPYSYNRPVFDEGRLLWDELQFATDKVLYGENTAEEALDAVTEKVNKILENN